MTNPKSGVEALQRAVIVALRADSTVAAIVQDRIFDEVPSDQDRPRPPYAYLGPVSGRRIEGGACVAAKAVTFRIFVVSTEFGRPEAWALIDAIEHALDGKPLPIAAPWSTLGDVVRSIQDGDVIQPLDPKSAFADFATSLARIGD